MIRFEPSGHNRKPVAYCDEPGCTAYAPFGFGGHLGKAIDQKNAKLAGTHFCSEHKPPAFMANSKEAGVQHE